jgi:hypothetical protein
MRHPDDYRLERWLAVLFSLLFLLPVVANAQPPASGTPPLPACLSDDVTTGSPILETEPDVRHDVPAVRFELSIRVTALEGRPSC